MSLKSTKFWLVALLASCLSLPASAVLIANSNQQYGVSEYNIGRTTDRYGNTDGAYLFGGIGSYISLSPYYGITSAESFSLAMNYRADGTVEEDTPLFDIHANPYSSSTEDRISFNLNNSGWFNDSTITVQAGAIGSNISAQNPFERDNNWHHIAISYLATSSSFGNLSVYFDQSLIYDALVFIDGPDGWGILQSWRLGRSTDDFSAPYFEGAISNLFIGNSSLTQTEVDLLASGEVLPIVSTPTPTPTPPEEVPEPAAMVLMALAIMLMFRMTRTNTL